MTLLLTLSKTTSNPTNKDKDNKTPLAMSYYPQLRAFLIWIHSEYSSERQSHKPLENHSATCKPLDSENNRIYMTVINLLSKDLSEVRKPA